MPVVDHGRTNGGDHDDHGKRRTGHERGQCREQSDQSVINDDVGLGDETLRDDECTE